MHRHNGAAMSFDLRPSTPSHSGRSLWTGDLRLPIAPIPSPKPGPARATPKKPASQPSLLSMRPLKHSKSHSQLLQLFPNAPTPLVPPKFQDVPGGQGTMQWIRGKLIGKGSYGRVYLALNATTGEIMAVKQVEIPKTASDRVDSRQMEVLESLKSESEMLKTVGEHPNIVQYLGIEESADYMSIFLEYVPGGTLRTLLTNRGRFDDLYVRYFTKQILTGLAFLHSKGVVHRDLKSDNILIEPDGVCKISDFGISKTPQDPNAKLFTEMKGTIFWMAPEVLGSRRRGYNCKVDIWSIGCIALEMWSGVRPWDGEELVPVMMKLYQGSSAPPLPSGIELCEEALNFRSKCFTVAPEERPSAAELERHPYLVIPPHWTFDASFMQPKSKHKYRDHVSRSKPEPDRKASRFSRFKMRSSKGDRSSVETIIPKHARANDKHANRLRAAHLSGLPVVRASQQHIPPVPPLPSLPPGALTSGLFADSRRSCSQPGSSTPKPLPGEGPPIVDISPPASPKNNIDLDYMGKSSESDLSSNRDVWTPERRRNKSFYVTNPDPDPDDVRAASAVYCSSGTARPYVYKPPPLPCIGLPSPSIPTCREETSDICPSVSNSTSTNRVSQETSTMTLSARLARRLRVSATTDVGMPENEYSSDSDDDGGILFQKAPKRRTIRAAAPRKGDAPAKEGTAVWAPRPATEDVYRNLPQHFPDHDLDRPVAAIDSSFEAAPPGDDDQSRRQRVKSIRMVAQERMSADRSRRRQTRLWGNHMEELSALRN